MKFNFLLLMLIVLLVVFNTGIESGKKKGRNKKGKSNKRTGSTSSSLNENLMECKNRDNNSSISNKSSSGDQCISAPERLEVNLSKGTGSKTSLHNLANDNANKIIAIYGNLHCISSYIATSDITYGLQYPKI